MIKLVVFDLDGVLVESKETHYKALNLALSAIDSKYIISEEDHLRRFDGLPTRKKLELLTAERGLPKEKHEQVWAEKQKLTLSVIDADVKENQEIIELMKDLKGRGVQIFVASNSIRETLGLYLKKLGLLPFIDKIVSNEDVKNPKPHPEIYLRCLVEASVEPKEALVIEDSFVGITSAVKSGANVFRVSSSGDVTKEKVLQEMYNIDNSGIIPVKWQGGKMNVLIPMAGAGSRFAVAGYSFPKPLIDVRGKPMIQMVVENLNIDAHYIYIVRKEHNEKYNLKHFLNVITPNCDVVEVEQLTEGAACTTLLARELINNDSPLLIANSDQFIEWDSVNFMYFMNSGDVDGGILTFKSSHPKWSYVKVNDEGNVTELAEKTVISDKATVGVYYWKSGYEYVRCAEQMIAKGEQTKVKGEWFVAPVYNDAIQEGKKIKCFDIERMWGCGTPEDLRYFLENYKGKL
jgi:HAD superfamily hydrolase (TIGR01509 family)